MTTKLTIDLYPVLEQRCPTTYRVIAEVDRAEILDYGCEDWTHQFELDAVLAAQRQAAVTLAADRVKALRPHLTDDQAWAVVLGTRDRLRAGLDRVPGAEADARYPAAKSALTARLRALIRGLTAKADTDPAPR